MPYTEKEVREICRQYDLYRAIQSVANPAMGKTFENEVSKDYNSKMNRAAKGPVTIPDFVLVNAFRAGRTTRSNRDVPPYLGTGANYGNGSALIQTDVLADEYISALSELTSLNEAGIRLLTGLTGNISIPKGGTVSAGWISVENGDAGLTSPTFDSVTAQPHCIGGTAKISRLLNTQSALSVQSIIAESLLRAIAEGIESAAFSGTGAAGQPKGLAITEGVQPASLSAEPTRAELVEIWKKVVERGVTGRNFAFIGTPAMKAILCQTLDIHTVKEGQNVVGAVTSGKYLCENDRVEGFPLIMSTLCGNSLWFGEWSQFCLCSWSGVDLIVDRFTSATSGAIGVTALQDVDFAIRRPEAFVKADFGSDGEGEGGSDGE